MGNPGQPVLEYISGPQELTVGLTNNTNTNDQKFFAVIKILTISLPPHEFAVWEFRTEKLLETNDLKVSGYSDDNQADLCIDIRILEFCEGVVVKVFQGVICSPVRVISSKTGRARPTIHKFPHVSTLLISTFHLQYVTRFRAILADGQFQIDYIFTQNFNIRSFMFFQNSQTRLRYYNHLCIGFMISGNFLGRLGPDCSYKSSIDQKSSRVLGAPDS